MKCASYSHTPFSDSCGLRILGTTKKKKKIKTPGTNKGKIGGRYVCSMALKGLYICAASFQRRCIQRRLLGFFAFFCFWAHIGGFLAGFGQTKDFSLFCVGLYLSVFHSPLFVSCFGKDLRGVETTRLLRHARLPSPFFAVSLFSVLELHLYPKMYIRLSL
jgi:hypothetical protein